MVSTIVRKSIKRCRYYASLPRSIIDSLASIPENRRYLSTWLPTVPNAILLLLPKPPRSPHLRLRLPLLTYAAVDWLAVHLDHSSTVFEFGAGGSTLWLADRVGQVITVEHNPVWSAHMQSEIRRLGLTNCEVLLREPKPWALVDRADTSDPGHFASEEQPGDYEAYATAIDDYPDESFDLVIVDGRSRPACLARSLPKVKPGGLLMLDDSNRSRYRKSMELVDGWLTIQFRGLRHSVLDCGYTTVWVKPAQSVVSGGCSTDALEENV